MQLRRHASQETRTHDSVQKKGQGQTLSQQTLARGCSGGISTQDFKVAMTDTVTELQPAIQEGLKPDGND